MKYIISAGHSGRDPGAVANGYKEAALAVALRNLIADGLRSAGHQVIEDEIPNVPNQELNDAIKLVNQHRDAQAWEIHFNASASVGASGVEVLAPLNLKSKSQEIAKCISSVLGSPIRGDMGWKPSSGGQHHRLGFCDAGGGIIEVEFISNRMAIDYYVKQSQQVADAIIEALL